METLLVFIAIVAIQMIAAYTKQKKEAAKKAGQKYIPPQEPTGTFGGDVAEEEPEYEFEQKYEFEPKPALEQELKSDIEPVRAVPHPVIVATPPPKEKKITNYKFNLKDPVQGILWTAILSEPRYKVKWRQR